MSKLKLRALNSKNISTNAIHYDLNMNSLLVSWKEIYKIIKFLDIIKNQFFILSKNNFNNKSKVKIYLNKKYNYKVHLNQNYNYIFNNFNVIQINKKLYITSFKHYYNNNNKMNRFIIEKNEFDYFNV